MKRLFGALDKATPDGAYRLSFSEDGFASKPELVIDNLYFANGFYIDEGKINFISLR